MSLQCETSAKKSAAESMGLFERYLSLWVLLSCHRGLCALAHRIPSGVYNLNNGPTSKGSYPLTIPNCQLYCTTGV